MKSFGILAGLALFELHRARDLSADWGSVASRAGCILHEGFRNPAVMASRHGGTMLCGMGMMGGLLRVKLPFAAAILAICVPVAFVAFIRGRAS
jgi:hypothetical protein